MPKPYYEKLGVTLYHGDSSEILAELKRSGIDLESTLKVSDPPYNVGYHYDACRDDMTEECYYRFMASIFSGRSVVIHYPEPIVRLSIEMHKVPERIVSWVYPSNTPRQSRSIAWYGCKPDFRKDGQDYRNPNDPRIAERIAAGKRARLYDWWEINQVKNVSSEKTEHPCQIPLAIMERILRITDNQDQPILEPFAGSGTTLLAARNLGKRVIGIEMSERYCELIVKRLELYESLV